MSKQQDQQQDIIIKAVDEASKMIASQIKAQEDMDRVINGLMREWIAAYMNDPRFTLPKAIMNASLQQTEQARTMQHTIAQMLATTAADSIKRTSQAASVQDLQKTAENLRSMMPFFNFSEKR
mgnify:CR=1 FL=1